MTEDTTLTSQTWLVAIDIGKSFHAVLVEAADGRRQYFRMANSVKDYDRLVAFLRALLRTSVLQIVRCRTAASGSGRERQAELGQEREAGALVQPAIQPQHPEARAVVERGVLKGPPSGNFSELQVDLDRSARLGLLEEFHRARRSFAGSPHPRQADVAKYSLDGPDRD